MGYFGWMTWPEVDCGHPLEARWAVRTGRSVVMTSQDGKFPEPRIPVHIHSAERVRFSTPRGFPQDFAVIVRIFGRGGSMRVRAIRLGHFPPEGSSRE